MTGNELVSLVRRGKERSFLVCKGTLAERAPAQARARATPHAPPHAEIVAVTIPAALPPPAPAPDDPAALGDGHRELAEAALDAPGDSRSPGGTPRRGGVRRDR